MADATPIPKRLKEARTRAELSQKELGIRAGIDEFSASARINQYEKGKHTPDYQTMERLAEVLGVTVSFFYARDNCLAELLLTWGSLTGVQRKQLLKTAMELA